MAKNFIIIVVLVIVAVIIYRQFFHLTPTDSMSLKIKNKIYQLEIARTTAQHSQGLMNRPTLCPDCGMIFVFSFESPQMFWMKNTQIPLDIIFLDKNGQVINIENATPAPGVSDFNLPLYKSTSPAQYVIELNAGDSQQLKLIPGDKIKLPQF